MALGDLLHIMRDAYCRTIGLEFMHIQDPEEKLWVQQQVEGVSPEVNDEEKRHILEQNYGRNQVDVNNRVVLQMSLLENQAIQRICDGRLIQANY